MFTRGKRALWAIAMIAGCSTGAFAQPFFMGGSFTYQGLLQDGGAPAAGPVDLVFRLYDAPSGGAQIGQTTISLGQTLVDGRFTADIDFNTVWNTSARWLEIDVRPTGTSQWVTLSPRQRLTPMPQASVAFRSDIAVSA